MVAGLLAREGFDAVTLDMQHGFTDFGVGMRAIPLIIAAGKPAIVRIPLSEFATAPRLLAGARPALSRR
jgi:4-hydroxy-2-oxoheptanedioate aldolase